MQKRWEMHAPTDSAPGLFAIAYQCPQGCRWQHVTGERAYWQYLGRVGFQPVVA